MTRGQTALAQAGGACAIAISVSTDRNGGTATRLTAHAWGQFIWLKNIERLHDTDMFARTIVSRAPFSASMAY